MNRMVVTAALLLIFFSISSFSQVLNDSLVKLESDLTFSGTRINPYDAEVDTSGKIEFLGYVDAYYATYSDTASMGAFQKIPTVSPRSNSFGINIAQATVKYYSAHFRSIATVFIGDVEKSAWSPIYSSIQEANVGFRLRKKLWIDAGFFRTHLGLESIQPRENMTLSIASTTYYEPYYLSGAKLTWEFNPKITIQANVFNSFNGFVDNNKNKAIGLSISYQPFKGFQIIYGNLLSEETPGSKAGNQQRFYNDLSISFKKRRFTLGLEINYGIQNHTSLQGKNQQAQMFSSLLAAKYRITPIISTYIRGEYFSDPNEILTGPVQNEYHQLIGLKIGGITTGFEIKPIPNSYLRIEGRWLDARKDEHIFFLNNKPSNYRYELLTGIGIWF